MVKPWGAEHHDTHHNKMFSALVTGVHDEPLQARGHSVELTVTVVGEDSIEGRWPSAHCVVPHNESFLAVGLLTSATERTNGPYWLYAWLWRWPRRRWRPQRLAAARQWCQ